MFRPSYFSPVLFFLLLPVFSLAQEPAATADSLKINRELYRVKSHDLIIGNHLVAGEESEFEGPSFYFLELGYARTISARGGHHGPGTAVMSVSQSFAINREFVTATRVGMSFRGWLASMGLYLSYYTDFEYGNLKIAPEFGMGLPNFKAVMGFNIPTINNRDFAAIQHGLYQFTLNFNLPLSKTRLDDELLAP
jgi:hypothetical protein